MYNNPMLYTTILSTSELADHLADPDWAIVDCRFWLADSERGRRDYQQAHIPGAVYAHLDEDLSGPIVPGKTGRHPLPAVDAIAQTFSNWGIDSRVQVVAYDDAGASMAGRVWWMLRWLGHDAVAVLDGGFPHWQKEGRTTRSGVETRSPRSFAPYPRPEMLASTADVLAAMRDAHQLVFDSRAAERYRGENETIDPVAGHIPGAVSAPYADNIGPDGLFLPREALRDRFEALLDDVPAEQTMFYCGSGVSAAQNLIALAHAGLGDARLYAGSWSEWIADPSRPIAIGNE